MPKDVELEFNGSDITRSFGFDSNTKLHESTISTSISTTNIYRSIYVYTDIIENQNTGDYKVSLRVVPIDSKYGDSVCVRTTFFQHQSLENSNRNRN